MTDTSTELDLPTLISDVEALLAALCHSDIVELEVASATARLRVRRRAALRSATPVALAPGSALVPAGAVQVATPLAGVFYRRPLPAERPFVEVGDLVVPGQVLCLIEAMKVFNEIRSEHAGRVSDVPVGDGQTVAVGTVLFVLEPTEGPVAVPPL